LLHERTKLLLGEEALTRLSQARVTVVGLGGVGGGAVEALARAGVGHLRLIDGDVVSESNLNRQILYTYADLQRPKALATANRISQIAPNCQVEPHHIFISEENIPRLIRNTDFVLDCIDSLPAKEALIVHCISNNIKIVSSMGAGNRLDPSRFVITDISKTHTDPLAREMRRRLREHEITNLPVVFSEEPPLRTGKPIGSVSFVPPVAGMLMAGYTIKTLVEK